MCYTSAISFEREVHGIRISKPPEERRAELISAARRLFDERGIQKTRISDIVGRVGVAQGVFYYYFPSKDAIIAEVIAQVDGEMEARANALLCDGEASFCQKLARFIDLYLELIDQFLADGETSLAPLEPDGLGRGGPTARGSAIITVKLLKLIHQGAAAGQIPAQYPEESALVLLRGLEALASYHLPGRQMIYTLAEQNLCLPKGSLLRYCDTPVKPGYATLS